MQTNSVRERNIYYLSTVKTRTFFLEQGLYFFNVYISRKPTNYVHVLNDVVDIGLRLLVRKKLISRHNLKCEIIML